CAGDARAVYTTVSYRCRSARPVGNYTEAEFKSERARPMRLCAGPRAKSRAARGSGDATIGFLSTAEIGGRGALLPAARVATLHSLVTAAPRATYAVF